MTLNRTTKLLAPLLIGVLLLLPKSAAANSPSWAPVPTFSPVNTFTATPTATVPTSLASSWRGIYTLPTYSLLERRKLSLRDLIVNPGATSLANNKRTYKYNPKEVYQWTKQLADGINTAPVDPVMKMENGRVTEFTAPQTGLAIDRYHSTLQIIEALQNGKNTAELVVASTEPANELEELNKLGIKELIGRGESKFNGSPKNRRHNIKVGVSKMRGVIIKPGEEFSFNKYLGSVEARDGYLPELVIRRDKGTVPELGGGLCQVSSTTFRAAMHAGLPITARRNHAYAVQYYAPQGSDATIYPGVQDLKFINDTGNSIMIWPYLKDENYLIFDFYGTFDGRQVELGTPYSYDRKASGAMKSTWTRTVTLPGKASHKDVFNSTYESPALFHKEETFVNANGTATDANGKPESLVPFVGTPPNTNTNTNTSN